MSSFDDEYALFKLEIEGLDDSTNNSETQQNEIQDTSACETNMSAKEDSNNPGNTSLVSAESIVLPDIENELSYLKGHKCQAPYYHNRSRNEEDDSHTASYHNALVISVHTPENGVSDINDIHVKVVFTHPIYKPMLTCPYYFDGDCKYSEERCFYSHGYLVKFIELKEYQNINYDNLHLNQIVLAKNLQTNIWHRAKITNFNTREDKVIVQFETGEGREGHTKNSDNGVEMELENIYPLDSDELVTDPHNSKDSESEEDFSSSVETYDTSKAIEISLNQPLDTRLGNWEKYTKGMGSKLMMKMGYVIGSGLGKNSEGRVEPVETYILPQGKSLDYCMNLREKCGGDEDMFKMEKINQRKAMKEIKKSKKNYENALIKEKRDVFGFLNKHLNQTPMRPSTGECSGSISKTSNAKTNLNIQTFQIDEKRKKYLKQLGELNKSLRRHDGDKQGDMYKKISREISIVNNEISALDSQDKNIHNHMKKQFNKKSLEKF